MNVHSWLKTAQTKITRLDAELILAHILTATRTHLHAHPEQNLTKIHLHAANRLLKRRQNQEPLAYLTGSKAFYGRPFQVTKSTLVPRPATEDLIDLAKQIHPTPRTILDIGTGTGCIAITLALELPGSAITATDINIKTLKVARQNAQKLLKNTHNITFLNSDLYKSPELQHKTFDLITANLPYVDPSWPWNSPDLKHEPASALFAPDHGLALIKQFIAKTPPWLNQNAHLLIESDPTQHPAIITFAKNHHLKHISTLNLILDFKLKP
jgi:release factor glutamine methyltransferase